MPAQLEEIVIHAHTPETENTRPDLRQHFFHGRTGRFVGGGRQCIASIRIGQGATVDLAVGQPWQLLQQDKTCGDHIAGQTLLEMPSKIGNTEGGVCSWLDVGHELGCLSLRTILLLPDAAHGHHRIDHIGMGVQRRLDLAQFNAETVDLHLLVAAPQELQHSIGAAAHDIAAGIKPGARLLAEGIGHKRLCRFTGAVEIPPGHARAADVQLARHAHRQQPHPAVQNIQLCVGQRPADGDIAGRSHPPHTGIGRRLGGTIHIVDFQMGEHLLGDSDQIRTQGLPAQEQTGQFLARRRSGATANGLDHSPPQGGNAIESHLLAGSQLAYQRCRIAQDGLGDAPHLPPAQKR